MPHAIDPTEPIRAMAAAFPEVAQGTSCNQGSFKVGKSSFLFIGPGAKGQGYKAMFKLDRSLPQARKLAASDPTHFEVGGIGWVTARFTAEKPLSRSIWEKWLKESYGLFRKPAAKARQPAARKKSARKR